MKQHPYSNLNTSLHVQQQVEQNPGGEIENVPQHSLPKPLHWVRS